MSEFRMVTDLPPRGDQPKAIEELVQSLRAGHKYTTLLGVTGSGKSVVPQTSVLVRIAGHIRLVEIGPLVERLMAQAPERVRQEGDTEVLDLGDADGALEAFSFDPRTGRPSWKRVLQVLRHRSPEALWRVTTACGCEVTVTGDHNFFALRNGRLTLLRTQELRPEDFLPRPRRLPEPTAPLQRLSLLEALTNSRNVYVQVEGVFVGWKGHADQLVGVLPASKRSALLQGERLSPAQYRTPVEIAPELSAAWLGTRHRKVQVPPTLELDAGLLRLIGFYVAEGHSEDNYFILSSADPEVTSDFLRTLKALGLRWYRAAGTCDYRVWSAFWSRLLAEWCGPDAGSKRLPPFWPELSNEQLGELLRAYFTADGGLEGARVTATTSSHRLASDLAYALLRFGIVARIRRRRRRAPGWQAHRIYWTVTISGQDALRTFHKAIGFFTSEKSARLFAFVSKTANRNVDVVPWNGRTLRAVREALGLTQAQMAVRVGCCRALVSLWEHGHRFPSRSLAERVVALLWSIAVDQENLSALRTLQELEAALPLFWTPVRSLERVPGTGFVYDLAVEGDETFLGGDGGVFVHNTYTMARVIERMGRPTLVIAHNKTLAAQLYSEFREFFPHNAVRYFVSYYDYYQPEAYVPQHDLYIAKDASINDEIDRLRHATTKALMERRDVIVVASVSCIYGLGRPEDYREVMLVLRRGEVRTREEILRRLVDIQYERNDIDFARGRFRVRGDVIEVFPSYEDRAVRIELFGDAVDRILELDPLTGEVLEEKDAVAIWPAKHWVTTEDRLERALRSIEEELRERVAWFRSQGKLLEAQRLEFRTRYDMELLRETGYCPGIENYSRHLDGRAPGERPGCLLDYFPRDFLMFIDESHVTVPQIKGMHEGDRARKKNLVDYGWRLPSAYDNRPLRWDEFEGLIHQCVFVSATPGPFELEVSSRVVEQIVRPTGLVDPHVEVRPARGQVDDLLAEIRAQVERGERTLVTTLTKRMAEDLTAYLQEMGLKVHYLHSEIDTLERAKILKDLRLGTYDVLVGINLLREGLDLPEVSLVAILDADREGYLRSETALIQTMGRAARHVSGRVILYADEVTDSMRRAIEETNRRRAIQLRYNEEHGITPQSVQKPIRDLIDLPEVAEEPAPYVPKSAEVLTAEELIQLVERQGATVPWDVARLLLLSPEELEATIGRLEGEMRRAAANLEFEKAARLRDQIAELKKGLGEPFFRPVARRNGPQAPGSPRRGRRGRRR